MVGKESTGSTPPLSEGSTDLTHLDESSTITKKACLVKDELKDLDLMRDEDRRKSSWKQGMINTCDSIRFNLQIAMNNPRICVFSFLVFSVLCSVGLALVFYLANAQNEEDRDAALDLAMETGRWFADQLNRAILPLFSLAQFVGEIDSFDALAAEVASRPQSNEIANQRNVDGVCDDPVVLERFNGIASSIKENADMDGVLVSLQMVPDEVVCMVYPLINTEDFEDGIVMNNTGAIGFDLLATPIRVSYVEAVLESEDIYIAGPFALEECASNGSCNVSVEKAFIAALPIDSEDHTISVGDKSYKRWGSVEAIINWKSLIERSNIFQRFESDGKGFQLTRKDDMISTEEPDKVSTTVTVLAETRDFDNSAYTHVSIVLDTVDDSWEMDIAYQQQSEDWLSYAIASTVIVTFFFAFLVLMVMIQKEKFRMMQKRYLRDLAQPQKLRLRMFLDAQASTEITNAEETQMLDARPIADFFTACTVMIADIAGFTSWASEREPAQVFKLLQTMFFHFDKICQKRGVLRVEASGDAFVVVAGIPEEQSDHAVRMCKVAQECHQKFNFLTRELEKQLGPETADLKIRIGLSSGPVVGGILLGGTSKFHIFGSTFKLATKMESTSEPDRIHLSEKTADLLAMAGKKKWVQARREKITVEGVGDVQTYFIKQRKKVASSVKNAAKPKESPSICSDSSVGSSVGSGGFCDDQERESLRVITSIRVPSDSGSKEQRLVDWQVESLLGLLKNIVAYRKRGRKNRKSQPFPLEIDRGDTVLDEVQEIIELPEFDIKNSRVVSSELSSVEISSAVEAQLRSLVRRIAALYHENPFHNFEHANHVTMAVHKLLNRIVTPEAVDYEHKNKKRVAQSLHDYTFGITSDPLTHFAVVFSALIHDVDHQGVSNPQLSKENPSLGEKYKCQSVAEQNSVDIAWDLLMQPEFADLRECLFTNREDYVRFRQLIVNTVMATDIFDPELKALRNMRWDRAFHQDELQRGLDISSSRDGSAGHSEFDHSESTRSDEANSNAKPTTASGASSKRQKKQTSTNRKATIVIEHIIQASDVAHTMQHWNVYKKWNEKLFHEMYLAFQMGRSAKDPSLGWYKGELWFFDNYVLPLAKKLDECGVFGVASDECLINAIENRREWACKGESVVAEILATARGTMKLGAVAEDAEDLDV